MRFISLLVVLHLALSSTMLAQDQASYKDKTGQKNSSAKWLKGTISDDGKSFKSDEDKGSWTITNPDEVKGHEGHHVKVLARVHGNTDSMAVTKVEMIKANAPPIGTLPPKTSPPKTTPPKENPKQ